MCALEGIMMVTSLRRYKQIADVLMKYGFGAVVLEDLSPGLAKWNLQKKLHPDLESLSEYERFRLVLQELGPTFVKFGQILSTRRELISPELFEELSKLQDKVAPLPFEEILPVIEEHCGDLSEAFESFEEEPFAAASISQVHRAVMKDGTLVAVKVQRPGIGEVIEVDLPIFEKMAQRAEKLIPDVRVYNPSGLVRDFAVQIRKELDFVRDGKNADRLSRNLSNLPGVKIPKIYWEYSGRRLLVMEFVKGTRIDDVDAMLANGVDPKTIAELGFQAYLQQVFKDGFFHGDPHPGNLLVTDTGSLVFLDFGMVGVIRPERRDLFIKVLLSIVEIDVDRLIDSFEDLGVSIREEDREPLKDELYDTLLEYQDFTLHQYNFGGMMGSTTKTLRRYHITVPTSLMQVLKIIWMMSDLAILLDPEFNVTKRIEPYVSTLLKERYLSTDAIKAAPLTMMEVLDGLMNLPRVFGELLKKIGTGNFKLEIAAEDLPKLGQSIDSASDKMLIGMVCAAVVVGSSILLHATGMAGVDGVWFLASIVAVTLGYILALVIGIGAVWHVFRKHTK